MGPAWLDARSDQAQFGALLDERPVEKSRGFGLSRFSSPGLESGWFKRRSQLRGGWRQRSKGDAPRSEAGGGGSLTVASSTPATPVLSPPKIRGLNHA